MSQGEGEIISADRSYEIGGQQLDAGLIRWQLDSDDLMRNFIASLLRCDVDNQGRVTKIKHLKNVVVNGELVQKEFYLTPLVNDVGLRDMKAYLESYLNKNMYLSEFDEFEIAEMVKETMLSIIGELYSNYKEYSIERQNLSMIVNIMFNYIYSAAKRAEGGAEKRFISTINKVIEHKMSKIDDPMQRQDSWLSWRRKR